MSRSHLIADLAETEQLVTALEQHIEMFVPAMPNAAVPMPTTCVDPLWKPLAQRLLVLVRRIEGPD